MKRSRLGLQEKNVRPSNTNVILSGKAIVAILEVFKLSCRVEFGAI